MTLKVGSTVTLWPVGSEGMQEVQVPDTKSFRCAICLIIRHTAAVR